MAQVSTNIVSLGMLRDLPLKVTLPDDLRSEIAQCGANAPTLEPAAAGQWARRLLELTERCIVFLDREAERVLHEKLASGDPMAIRNKAVGEIKREADGKLALLKQHLAAERTEWNARVSKQLMDMTQALDTQLTNLEVETRPEGTHTVCAPTPGWLRDYDAWKQTTFSTWANHVAKLLPSRYQRAVAGDLEGIERMIGSRLVVTWPAASPTDPPERDSGIGILDRFEVPTVAGAIFESFKGGLNTVAMIAGMVVIPVVGSLMHESPVQIRAAVMGGLLVPIIGFAARTGRTARTKLIEGQVERAKDKIRRQMKEDFKVSVERFKLQIERTLNSFAAQAQPAVLDVVESAVTSHIDRRERELAPEIARVQAAADRIGDTVNLVKMSRSGLATQLIIDLRRKIAEADATV